MEEITAVCKGTTFFLLLVLAASDSATALNTTQQNTAITATSGKQVRRAWGVHVHEPKTLGTLINVGTLTIHTIQLFLQKKAISSFPLKACTSSNVGEMWTAEGGAQVDSIWVCQNSKWIPYE